MTKKEYREYLIDGILDLQQDNQFTRERALKESRYGRLNGYTTTFNS